MTRGATPNLSLVSFRARQPSDGRNAISHTQRHRIKVSKASFPTSDAADADRERGALRVSLRYARGAEECSPSIAPARASRLQVHREARRAADAADGTPGAGHELAGVRALAGQGDRASRKHLRIARFSPPWYGSDKYHVGFAARHGCLF
jgi:hypothetical protein